MAMCDDLCRLYGHTFICSPAEVKPSSTGEVATTHATIGDSTSICSPAKVKHKSMGEAASTHATIGHDLHRLLEITSISSAAEVKPAGIGEATTINASKASNNHCTTKSTSIEKDAARCLRLSEYVKLNWKRPFGDWERVPPLKLGKLGGGEWELVESPDEGEQMESK